MELTPEQIQAIVAILFPLILAKVKEHELKDIITKPMLIEIVTGLCTKQDLEDLKNAIATSEAKTNEAVKKIADETETKIQTLRTTPAQNKAWYDKELI